MSGDWWSQGMTLDSQSGSAQFDPTWKTLVPEQPTNYETTPSCTSPLLPIILVITHHWGRENLPYECSHLRYGFWPRWTEARTCSEEIWINKLLKEVKWLSFLSNITLHFSVCPYMRSEVFKAISIKKMVGLLGCDALPCGIQEASFWGTCYQIF